MQPPTSPTTAPHPDLRGVRVWMDGEVLGPGASLPVLDHGVSVGDGAFETAKVEDGRVFARTRHHDRMAASLAALGIGPVDRRRVDAGIDALVGGIGFGRVRWVVTAGPGPLGSDRLDGAPTVLVTAMELPRPAPTATVAVVPWTRNERGALAGVKSTSYAENVVALQEAHRLGAAEALLANTAGELCEGTGSNVFVVTDGVVRTPALTSGPLAGITRALTLEWLRADGLEVVEERLPLTVLDEAEEVWITSSTRDICAVTRFEVTDERRLVTGTILRRPPVQARILGEGPGPVARRAQEVFTRRARQSPET